MRSQLLKEPFVLPHGMEKAKKALKVRFPSHAKALDELFKRMDKTLQFADLFGEQHSSLWWLWHAPVLLIKFWPVFTSMKKSLADVFQQLFGNDEAIKIALAANLGYYSDDPGKMWWFFYAIAQGGFLAIGGSYIKGGSKTLTDRLLKVIEDAGGTTLASRLVTHILLDENGRACGVEHESNQGGEKQIAYAPVLFGNAAPHVLAETLPAEVRSEFMQAYNDKPLSLTLFSISLGLARHPSEFGVSNYSTFLVPDWVTKLSDYRDYATLLSELPAERFPGIAVVDYSRIHTGLNEQPPYLMSVVGTDQLENWQSLSEQDYHAKRDQWLEAIIQLLDNEFPGIAGAITQKEMATALSMHRYLNTPGGALYGFAPEPPKHFSLNGPPRTPQTSIEGLWLASAYAGTGGFTGTMLSSTIAARMALNEMQKK